MKRILAALIVVGLLFAGLLVLSSNRASAAVTPRPGGWVDSIVWFPITSGATAKGMIDSGTMDMYLYQLSKPSDLAAALADSKLSTITVPGITEDLVVNPVGFNQTLVPGQFNPFQIQEVRTALNYLIDRNYIVREIYNGAAFAQLTPESSQSPEYARDPLFFAGIEQQYAYNPAKAQTMIFDGMSSFPGVSFSGGQWYWNGNLVVIQLEERLQDQRLDIGHYVAAQLRTMGFSVNEKGVSSGYDVYSVDPANGLYSIYTEGWITTAFTAWADVDPYFYYCGGAPDAVFAPHGPYTPAEALLSACNRLYNAQYTNLANREALMETGISMGVQDGVRQFIAGGATFMYGKNLMAPFAYDLAGGPNSFFSTRSAQLLDSSGNPTVGGQLLAGSLATFYTQQNPWRGEEYIYDVLPIYDISDPGLWTNPHTGLFIPVRSNFTVQTGGPIGSLAIPSGSYTYNVTGNTWDPVPSGTNATSKVTFAYTFGSWHDGAPFTMADVLYSTALTLRRVSGDVHTHDGDSALSADFLFASTFKGLRVVDSTHIEFYLNYWTIDPTTIAYTAAATTFPSLSWDESEAAILTVLHDWTRLSDVTAEAQGKTATDLMRGATLGYMNRELTTNMSATYLPPSFGTGSPFASYFSTAETTTRLADLATWYTAHTNYYSSNGPYYLDSIDTASGQLTLKNWNGYPYMSDRWASLIPVKIPSVSMGTPPQVVPGIPATFNVTTTFQGAAYDKLNMSYVFINPATNAVLYQGTPTETGAGTGVWQISLTGNQTGAFVPGAYTLETITVGQEAAVPVFSTRSFVVIPALAYFEALLGTQLGLVNNQITQLEQTNSNLQSQLTTANNNINGLTGILYASIAVAVVSLVVAALSVVMLMRSRPKGGRKEEPSEPEEPPKGPEEL